MARPGPLHAASCMVPARAMHALAANPHSMGGGFCAAPVTILRDNVTACAAASGRDHASLSVVKTSQPSMGTVLPLNSTDHACNHQERPCSHQGHTDTLSADINLSTSPAPTPTVPSSSGSTSAPALSRRQTHAALAGACATLALAAAASGTFPAPAAASKLPVFADKMWEAMGGGPSDLTFPPSFLGTWDVTSILTQVDVPQGPEMVPDMRVVERAKSEDLNKPVTYQVRFVSNASGEVVFDRAYNTASLLSFYYGRPTTDFLNRIEWNISDPNVLQLTMPGGLSVRTRVTRRSEEEEGPRIETSEYFEQVYDSSETSSSGMSGLRVKASQCFTKYKWRDESAAGPGQPAIVATQVVSDYLTPVMGQEAKYMQAGSRPVVIYTYRMSFVRAAATA
eukprot:CAMPEP_0202873964 /NCGR_PEP_ID=MMETSP1391-20130828/24396_1 /ASSEMBLY_ACC=CAM_ASM_000867 /TAXON_ID=1034604 /ORGANISM="Chlamydomonas leiostraca, Strain SAG 11-49" /LENGTH=395 /DNA_ID=CAMNT_0049555285 /DNA_START=44 /DNA_END=1231 /DNA_ORIENTATION=-